MSQLIKDQVELHLVNESHNATNKQIYNEDGRSQIALKEENIRKIQQMLDTCICALKTYKNILRNQKILFLKGIKFKTSKLIIGRLYTLLLRKCCICDTTTLLYSCTLVLHLSQFCNVQTSENPHTNVYRSWLHQNTQS